MLSDLLSIRLGRGGGNVASVSPLREALSHSNRRARNCLPGLPRCRSSARVNEPAKLLLHASCAFRSIFGCGGHATTASTGSGNSTTSEGPPSEPFASETGEENSIHSTISASPPVETERCSDVYSVPGEAQHSVVIPYRIVSEPRLEEA
jgi:hypothetical protein